MAAQLRAQPAASAPAGLPPRVSEALNTIEDFSFSFAQPGFYALLEYVKSADAAPPRRQQAIEIDDWRELLERPADFRGLPVTIEGRIGRNSKWRHQQERHRHLGTVWQLELSKRDAPIACTLILTEPADDLALGMTVRVTGYFVMIRQYYGATNRVAQAALIMAQAPSAVSAPAPPAAASREPRWVGLIVAATAGLLLVWILLRRSTAARIASRAAPRAEHAAPFSLADDLRDWAQRDDPMRGDDNAHDKGAES